MPDDPELPFIRGRMEGDEPFRNPRGGGGDPIPPAVRNPSQHSQRLLGRLDAIAQRTASRPADQRDPAAARELIAVHSAEGTALDADPLGDARADVRVVSRDEKRGTALIDTPNADLPHLRRKIARYGDDESLTEKGNRSHEPLVAPIEEFALAAAEDLAGLRLVDADLGLDDVRWFEVACRGGHRRPVHETANSREQIHRQLEHLGVAIPEDYIATEHVVFFVRLSMNQLRALVETVDCIYEFDLAAPELRDWLYSESVPGLQIDSVEIVPPDPAAPAIVLLDTGVTTSHPLLSPAILSADSVDPFDGSPEDVAGHGTEMSGIAVHPDLGRVLDQGSAETPHWLQSVKLFRTPRQGGAAEEQRPYWPKRTEDAVRMAENDSGRRRCFALPVTSEVNDLAPTFWSHAIDRLAYNEGHGRLMLVSSGNADTTNVTLIDDYPQMHLEERIREPAQSVNALTIGAYTERTTMPPDADLAAYKPVAPTGGVSPYTSAGGAVSGEPIKPEIVFEGGNMGFDGKLPSTMETMSGLTTSHRYPQRPLAIVWGTSEACARAARLAASVWATSPELRPETVRGLVVHAASWTPAMLSQFKGLSERLAICGYGVPNEGFARACTDERATVIIEDRMPNRVAEERPKTAVPKRPETKTTETHWRPVVRFFRLPVPEDELIALGGDQVELRVTLSYLPEPNIERRCGYNGLDLRWDMQGPQENEGEFRERINLLQRAPGESKKKRPPSFKWDIGPDRRSRGTVQSDRWSGAASVLAGTKLIAVYPTFGWWDRRPNLRDASMDFSLIVTVMVPGLSIYTPIRAAVEAAVEIEI